MPTSLPERAFVLRMSHGRDRVSESLERGEIVIGWAEAEGLLASDAWLDFREIIHRKYHIHDDNYQRSGASAGHAWRFLKEMEPGAWVVVPWGNAFLIAEVMADATYDRTRVGDDSAYTRRVRWLNDGRAIPRATAHAPLQSRMKVQGTTANASDLIQQIGASLTAAAEGRKPSFATDLRERLVREALSEIRSGRIDSFGFERLVGAVLRASGGTSVRVVPHQHDKGADVTAEFRIAGALTLRVAVQAKHYQPHPPVPASVVDDLVAGMDAENAHYGIVATSGTISAEAQRRMEHLAKSDGRRIELVDGEQFAALIVDLGLSSLQLE